ncbi:MAG: copper amine oxidase N-terminal domain-containing protein [Chitinophagales bacterium]
MSKPVHTRLVSIGLLICFSLFFLSYQPGTMASTTYRILGDVPKYSDAEFVDSYTPKEMATVKIVASTKDTFVAQNLDYYYAEFRLPGDFYFETVGNYENDDEMDNDIVIEAENGFSDPNSIYLVPTRPDRENPGHYRAFEVRVTPMTSPSTTPEMIIYFNRVYVPYGASGNVTVEVTPDETAAFSSGTINIASIEQGKLQLKVEEPRFIEPGTSEVGPVTVTENLPGAFQYLDYTLSPGYSWILDSLYIEPTLGLKIDTNGDGLYNKEDFQTELYTSKFGDSVLRISLNGKSKTKGTFKFGGYINVEPDAPIGDVNITVEGESDPSPLTLKLGTHTEYKTVMSAGTAPTLYPGRADQNIAEITITENTPGTLLTEREISLELPQWAQWSKVPKVKAENSDGLMIGAPYLTEENRCLCVPILGEGNEKAGRIRIYDAKVNVGLDGNGDLKVTAVGTAEVSGEAVVGKVNAPLTITAKSVPQLYLGKGSQAAGDIEIKESAARVLLVGELWLDFPENIYLPERPKVTVTGNLRVEDSFMVTDPGGLHRLVIPITRSSYTSASTITVSGINYMVDRVVVQGDVKVKIGGPALDEVAKQAPLDLNSDFLIEVANATIGLQPGSPGQIPTETKKVTVVFKIDDKQYTVDGTAKSMDVAPYVVKGRTFVPLRYAGLALGIPDKDITWDQTTKIATLCAKDAVIRVPIGQMAIYRWETKIPIDVPAHIKNARTMVPLRAISEAFKADVQWDSVNRTVTITY